MSEYRYSWYGHTDDGFSTRHEAAGELAKILRGHEWLSAKNAAGLLLVADVGGDSDV